MAETAGDVGRDARVGRVVMFTQAEIAGTMAGLTAAIENQGGMALGTINARIDKPVMDILSIERGAGGGVVAPGGGIVADRTVGDGTGIGVAIVT